MDSDSWQTGTLFQGHDHFGHHRKLIPLCDAKNAASITATRRSETKAMMRMPVSEVPKPPISRESPAQFPEVVDIEPEVRGFSTGCRTSLRGKQQDWNVVPAPEQIASGLDGPRGRFRSNCT